MLKPTVLIRTLGIAAVAMGLAASCKAKLAPQEPTGIIQDACCKVISKDLQSGAGCRATNKCADDEKIWMRGAVTCSPVEPEKCLGGRCCTYRKMYGSDDALYNWDPGEGAAEEDAAPSEPEPAEPTPTTPATETATDEAKAAVQAAAEAAAAAEEAIAEAEAAAADAPQ